MYAYLDISHPVFFSYWIKFAHPRQIFEKSSNTKFNEYPSSGSPAVPCEETDTHDEAKFCFSKITNALKHARRYSYTSVHPYHGVHSSKFAFIFYNAHNKTLRLVQGVCFTNSNCQHILPTLNALTVRVQSRVYSATITDNRAW